MNTRSKLLLVAEAYRAASKKSLATVGKSIADNSTLFAKLAAGHGCTIDTYDKAMDWFSTNWPEEVVWPNGVERPQSEGRAA